MQSPSSQPRASPAGSGADPEAFPQVFGKYVLLRPMARGGMGELFLAAAGETGGFEKLTVVKKVIPHLEDAGVHRRFLDEAKVVVRLNHANLVQVFDAGRVGNDYYLAMELVEGKDLRAVWNRCAQLHRRIPVDVAILAIREVARGLAYVHDAMGLDLVHRDVSPPNLLIGYHGEVKLTDFGLAKSAIKREMTSPGVVFGRYSYLSPEQARGLPADRRTDIYAAAIVLWELLTGRQLFPSSNRSHKEALAAVRNPVVKPPSQVVPGVPPGLDDVVMRALAKEREDRYATANDFRAALSEILAAHFPSCDADRVSEFMREIFSREIKFEMDEYSTLARQDFTRIRANAEQTEILSISDVIMLEQDKGTDTHTIPLSDADIVELDAPKPKAKSPSEPRSITHTLNAEELRASAQHWLGNVIAQRYRVDALIGIGGMGAVFRATHVALGKPFALKILHGMYTRDPDIVARFMREARAATQTGHPNIIDVIDVGSTDDGNVYFVMELLEGDNLGRVVERDGPLAIRRTVHIARQICKALAAAHEVGIIHRDLKSENVFLTGRGKDPDFVKVLDFGICKQIDADTSQTSPGLVMGSPDYMAPEQAAGIDASVAADIYAVGCILFEMLSGRLPYQGRNAIDVLMKKSGTDAPRVTLYRPEVPEVLSDVVARCLRRRPEHRPASMRVLEYELTRAVEGRASAVAAVLGLSAPHDTDATLRSGEESGVSSARLNRAAIMTPSAHLPLVTTQQGLRTRLSTSGTYPLVMPADPSVQRSQQQRVAHPPQRPLVGGLKALFFVVLGGLLAGGAVVWLSPDAARSILPLVGLDAFSPTEVQPSERAAPALPPKAAAEPAIPPLPPPSAQPPAQEAAEVADPSREPLAIVARAEQALKNEHWREPADASLAIELANLSLVDPSNEAIGRLRRAAADTLMPAAQKAARRKRWDDAVKIARDLVAVWPDHADARAQLADSLANQARRQLQHKKYDEALGTADELLNLDAASFDAIMLRADALAGEARWSEAKESYGKARDMRPYSRSAKKGYWRSHYMSQRDKTP